MRPEFIPAPDMDHYDWWFPVRPGLTWFYWSSGSTPASAIHDPKWIDPLVRPVIHLLHRAGVKTTNTCQGHFPTQPEVRQTLHQLTKDAHQIRTSGLRFRNISDGREVLFKHPKYADVHPESFRQANVAAAGLGVLNFVGRPDLAAALRNAGFRVDSFQDRHRVWVPSTSETNRQTWQRLEAIVAVAL